MSNWHDVMQSESYFSSTLVKYHIELLMFENRLWFEIQGTGWHENNGPPSNTKYGLFLIILCKRYGEIGLGWV